jgi:hypothetical protein
MLNATGKEPLCFHAVKDDASRAIGQVMSDLRDVP